MFYVPISRQTFHRNARQSQGLAHHIDSMLAAAAQSESQNTEAAARSPALDLSESDTSYTVTLDMHGVRKEDVKVSVEGQRVSVQAEASSSGQAELKKEGERLIYRERSNASARYARQFVLPQEVDSAQAHAQFEHGVLTLTLPKRAANVASQITIN